MKHLVWIVGTLVATCWTAWITCPAKAQDQNSIEQRIDAYAKPFVEAGHLSGTLLVAEGDQVLYHKSWGFADRERSIPFRNDTISCIASVSKPVTVIIASHLIENEQLSLDDPLSKYFEDFPRGDEILVKHLLYHRAGIPHRLTEREQETVFRSPRDMVELASKTELEFDPGTSNQYSSGGFAVLAALLEKASGKSYEQLLTEIVLDPLDLSATRHPGKGADLSGAAFSYAWTKTGMTRSREMDYSFLVGAGSLFSHPEDLFKIARALVEGKFGDRAKRQLIRFGKLGWNGITNNYRCYLNYDAKTDVTIVLVANQMVGANDLLRMNVPRLVAGAKDVRPPKVPQPDFVDLPAERLKTLSGRYQIAGSPMNVIARDGCLFANDWILIPTATDTFFSPQDYGRIKFLFDDEGRPTGMEWGGGTFKRLGPLK